MHVSEAILTRSSCRAFSDQPVPREALERIMDLTHRAPSAINLQPWQFTVVMGQEVARLGKKLTRAFGERGFSCKPDNTAPLAEVYGQRQAELGRLMAPLMQEAGADKSFINTGSLTFYGAPAVVVGHPGRSLPAGAGPGPGLRPGDGCSWPPPRRAWPPAPSGSSPLMAMLSRIS